MDSQRRERGFIDFVVGQTAAENIKGNTSTLRHEADGVCVCPRLHDCTYNVYVDPESYTLCVCACVCVWSHGAGFRWS